MQCQACHQRVATVHFTRIVNNHKVEMHLCEQCAREKGAYGFEMPLSVGNFFASFLGLNDSDNSSKRYIQKLQDRLRCNKCGMTIEEFQGSGKLGCNACYDTFGENLKPLIRRLHGSLEHTGKIPSRLSKSVSITREIARLKELLNKAVEREEYEKAAEIRDKIKSLEVNL